MKAIVSQSNILKLTLYFSYKLKLKQQQLRYISILINNDFQNKIII